MKIQVTPNTLSHREQHRAAARALKDAIEPEGRKPTGEEYSTIRHMIASLRRAEAHGYRERRGLVR